MFNYLKYGHTCVIIIIDEEVFMGKGNIHKKLTFEDKFSRKYACWVKNNPKSWNKEKKSTRKKYRHMMNREVDNE